MFILVKLYRYIKLCLKVSHMEHMGLLTKEEGDRICLKYWNGL